MEAVGMLSMLGLCTFEDIRRKRIHILLVLGFGIIGVGLHLLFGRIGLMDMLGGMSVGFILMIISIISHEKIGKGDALLFMVTGIYVGFWNNLFLLWVSSMITGIIGFIYIIRGNRNKALPFVPFVLVTYVIFLMIKGGSLVS